MIYCPFLSFPEISISQKKKKQKTHLCLFLIFISLASCLTFSFLSFFQKWYLSLFPHLFPRYQWFELFCPQILPLFLSYSEMKCLPPNVWKTSNQVSFRIISHFPHPVVYYHIIYPGKRICSNLLIITCIFDKYS